MEEEWFILSTTGSVITVITAGIMIIQFSREYKLKSPIQSVVFLSSGVLMLCLGFYMNNIIMHYTNENNKFKVVPQTLLYVNIVFALYAFYVGVKRLLTYI